MILPTFSKKIFALVLSFAFLGLTLVPIITPKAHAQTQPYNNSVPQTEYTRVQTTFLSLIGTIICTISGVDVIDPTHGCMGIDPINGVISYAPANESGQVGGLLGMTSGLIESVYTPPATTSESVRYLADNFGLEKRAYAQEDKGGFGYLSSVQNIWLKVRNIAYLGLVIAFMVIGFAIMLRVKIDPRTVMSIQNQIPKIIIGVILITFSYSIVGLMVDLMWATTYFGINVLTEENNTRRVATESLNDNPIEYTSHILSTGNTSSELTINNDNLGKSDIKVGGISGISFTVGKTIGDVVSRSLSELLFLGADNDKADCSAKGFLVKIVTLGIAGGDTSVAGCLEDGFKAFLKYLVAVIAFLVIGLAILIALFRTWLSLLRAFVYVVIYTILGPLQIVAGLFPGSTYSFSTWFRAVLAHLLLFPVTAMVLVLARIFAENSALNNPEQTFVPPFIVNPNALDNMGSLIAFGLIMIVPELLTFVRDAVKSKPGPFGGIIAKGFNAGMPAVSPLKNTWKSLNTYDLHKGEVGALGQIRKKASQRVSTRFKKIIPFGPKLTNIERGTEERERVKYVDRPVPRGAEENTKKT